MGLLDGIVKAGLVGSTAYMQGQEEGAALKAERERQLAKDREEAQMNAVRRALLSAQVGDTLSQTQARNRPEPVETPRGRIVVGADSNSYWVPDGGGPAILIRRADGRPIGARPYAPARPSSPRAPTAANPAQVVASQIDDTRQELNSARGQVPPRPEFGFPTEADSLHYEATSGDARERVERLQERLDSLTSVHDGHAARQQGAQAPRAAPIGNPLPKGDSPLQAALARLQRQHDQAVARGADKAQAHAILLREQQRIRQQISE